MSDINIDLSFESVNVTLGFIDVATLTEANAYTDKKVIDSGGETPETIKVKYESNQSVIDRLARLENTSGTNTGDQDLSDYLLIENLPTSFPASDVYAWAKASTKPTYTPNEVGAEPIKGADQLYVSAAEKALMLTEQTKFVLSALDAQITIGQKAKDTVKVKHQITASDISNDLTVAPQNFDIILDIKKNGTSIFSTKPKITAGQLVLDGNHALTTSSTIFNVGDTKTIHIDQTGFGETGQNLNLYILTHKIL